MRKYFIISFLALTTLSIFLACNDDPPTSSGGDDDKRAYLTIIVTDTLYFPISEAMVKVAGYYLVDSVLITMIDWTDEAGQSVGCPTVVNNKDTLSIWVSKENYAPESTQVRVEYDGQKIGLAFHLKPS